LSNGILFDSVKCIGCGTCCEACKGEHSLGGDANPDDLGADTLTVVKEIDGVMIRKLCRHCLQPACVSVCPVGALLKLPNGPVIYNTARCIGCRYCFVACPYSIPRYEWRSSSPRVRKCDMCAARLSRGEPTACAEVCPRQATLSGDRDELLTAARARIKSSPDPYFPHVFGEFEAGGSSVLFIASRDISQIGMKMARSEKPWPALTDLGMKSVPPVGIFTGTALFGLWWTFKRRKQVKALECRERKPHDK